MSATLLINPMAGRGKCRKRYPEVVKILREAGLTCDEVVSQYPGHIMRVSSEVAARGQETVIVCGGDGAVNEAINGVAGTQTALGIVPLGTANLLATKLGLPKDIQGACKTVQQRHTERIDLIRLNDDKFFAGIGCVGFDSEVAAFVGRRRKEKSSPFFRQFVGSVLKYFSYQPKTVELRFNEDRFYGKILLVVFGNGLPCKQSSPENHFEESALSVSVVRPMSKWRLFTRFPSVFKKADSENKEVSVHKTGSVHMQSKGPMELYVDGDYMTTTPFRLEIMPKHLQVIANAPLSLSSS